MLGIATVIALILRYEGDEMGIEIGPWKVNCKDDATLAPTPPQSPLNPIPDIGGTYYPYCKGDAAVYRISFVLTIFFFCTMLGSICSPAVHRGWWGPKLFAFFALLIGSIWIPNNVFDNSGYAWIARFCSTLFLLLQILILIDFGYQWNESWVARAFKDGGDEPSDKKWLILVIASAATQYILTIVGIVLLFIYYAECGLGQATIAVSLIAVIALTALSLFREQIVGEPGAILPAAVVSLYAVYLNWSALDSHPDTECKPAEERSAATITIGILVAAVSLMWTSYSASKNAQGLLEGKNAEEVEESSGALEKPFYRVDDGKPSKNDDQDEDVEEGRAPSTAASANDGNADDAKESYWFFHLIMMTASMYMAMLLTNWGTKEWDSSEETYNNSGESSMWVKIVSEWLTIALYIWTLIAPRVLSGREF